MSFVLDLKHCRQQKSKKEKKTPAFNHVLDCTVHWITKVMTPASITQFDKKKVIFCPHVLMVIFPFLGGKNDGK